MRSSRADVGAAPVGQEQVEDHRLGRAHRRLRERVPRGRRGVDGVAGVAQLHLERAQDLPLVVDDEHARAAHAGPPHRRRARTRTSRRGPVVRLEPEAAAVHLEEAARDREPEPRAARAVRVRAARERLEDRLALVRRRCPGRRRRRERRPRRFLGATSSVDRRRDLERVLEQVHERALELRASTRTASGSAGSDDVDRVAAGADRVERPRDEAVDRPDLELRRGGARLEPRQVEQVRRRAGRAARACARIDVEQLVALGVRHVAARRPRSR